MPGSPLTTIKDLVGLGSAQWQSLDLRESHRRAPCFPDHAPGGFDALILGSSRDASATPPPPPSIFHGKDSLM